MLPNGTYRQTRELEQLNSFACASKHAAKLKDCPGNGRGSLLFAAKSPQLAIGPSAGPRRFMPAME